MNRNEQFEVDNELSRCFTVNCVTRLSFEAIEERRTSETLTGMSADGRRWL